mgnify:CR=1 FL=1
MTRGTLSRSFSAPYTFTATITAPPGYNVASVTLTSPSGMSTPMTMMNSTTWSCSSNGQPPGTWTAIAMLQVMGQCSGSTTI